jgi:hypothetical protein
MEYKPTSITVDQPFMSQQAFRDFLKLPSEESAQKIGLHDLLEVAKVVIRDELVSCGCSENELTGFRIECQVLKGESQELGEVYSAEWKQLPQSEQVTGNNNEVAEEPPEVKLNNNFPRSLEFIGKLTERIDESLLALDHLSLKTSTNLDLSFSRFTSVRLVCDATCGQYKRKYERDENGNEYDKGCSTTLCMRNNIEI